VIEGRAKILATAKEYKKRRELRKTLAGPPMIIFRARQPRPLDKSSRHPQQM
jgi:hypothetical protein